jgi:hypothetical protein
MPAKTGIQEGLYASHWTPALHPRRAKQATSLCLALAGVTLEDHPCLREAYARTQY